MASPNQLKQLGYRFLYKPGEGVFIYRDGTSNAPGLERLRKETKESIAAQGFPVETVDSLKEYSSLPGFGFASGDVDTVAKVNQIADKFVEQLKVGMSRTTEDGTKIGIGNRDFDRATAEAIVGDKVPFSEKALAEQYSAGEAQAKAKNAEIAAAQPKTRAQINTERIAASGKTVGTDISEREGRFYVHQGEKLVGSAGGYDTMAQALAAQTQLASGGTPSLSDFPEIYSRPPTQAEIDAGIQPIQKGDGSGKIVIPIAAVNPELALKVEQTPESAKANKEFVNAVVEAYTGSPATQEQLNDLVGKKVLEVKEVVKQETPINQLIKEQVELIYGDVTKLTAKDIPEIATSEEAIKKLETWKQTVMPTLTEKIPDIIQNQQAIQERIDTMQEKVEKGIVESQEELGRKITKGLEDLSEAGKESAQTIVDSLKDDPAILQKLLEGIPLTPEDIEKALVEKRKLAKSETDPYYNQLIQRAQEDFTLSLQYESEQRKLQQEQQAMRDQLAKEQLEGGLAEQGLATSGIRRKLEARMAQQQEGVARSQRLQFARQSDVLGRQAEEYLGSANVQNLALPQIEGQFKPSGGVKGAVEREQTTNIETRARDLLRRENLLSIAGIEGAPLDLISNLV